eukprot:gene4403-7778_t
MNNQKISIPNLNTMREVFQGFKTNNIGLPLFIRVIDQNGIESNVGIDYFRKVEIQERMTPTFEMKATIEQVQNMKKMEDLKNEILFDLTL